MPALILVAISTQLSLAVMCEVTSLGIDGRTTLKWFLKMIFEDVVEIYLAQDRDKSRELVITVI